MLEFNTIKPKTIGLALALTLILSALGYVVYNSPAAWYVWHHDILGKRIYCSPWHACPADSTPTDYFGTQYVDREVKLCEKSPAYCQDAHGFTPEVD